MKIRIKDNSIRFRLTQSEVAKLGEDGVISSFTEFVDHAHCGLPHITVVSAANALHTVDGAIVLPDEAVVHIDCPTGGKIETNSHITSQTNGERVVHFGSHNLACLTMHHLCSVAA